MRNEEDFSLFENVTNTQQQQAPERPEEPPVKLQVASNTPPAPPVPPATNSPLGASRRLVIEPTTLSFKGKCNGASPTLTNATLRTAPYNRLVNQSFLLANHTDRDVAFKVKATVPRQYIVRPVMGVVRVNCTATVHINLKPIMDSKGKVSAEFDPSNQKFLLLWLRLPEGLGDVYSVAQLVSRWSILM